MVDSPNVLEWWHLQPIETIGYTGDRSKFADREDAIYGKPDMIRLGARGTWVTELCRLMNIPVKTVFDEDLRQRVINAQGEGHLTADGIVGPITWGYLYKNIKV